MADMKILEYLRKWSVPIIILSLLAGYVFSSYISGKQTYSASVIIEYTNSLASQGKTPTGDGIDVKQITASNVISGAIRELDLSVSIDFIRSRIGVDEIIPEDVETRIGALLEKGEESTYFPTSYLVSFKVGADYSAEFARRVLESVMRNYILFYGEKYVDVTLTPGSMGDAVGEGFDYIESIDLVQSSLSDVIAFLSVRAEAYPTFYCSVTGLSFGNLLDEYEALRDINAYRIHSRILDGRLSRDPESLVAKYRHQLDEAKVAKTAYEEKVAAIEPLIEAYSEKSIEGRVVSAAQGDETGSQVTLTTFVSATANQQTTYDALMDSYVNYTIALAMYDQDIQDYTRMISIFDQADAEGMNSPDDRAQAESELLALVAREKELYGMLLNMIAEFNEYQSTLNLTMRSTINVTRSINTKLYTLVALVFFVVVGALGTIVLCRVSEIARYHKYFDPKTDLPNRAGCDKEIDRLDEKTLEPDVCCAYITLTNLNRVNSDSGRKQGDIMLKNFGVILKYCAARYGFAGYNGGQNFICAFEHCKLDRAQSFKQMLLDAVSNYNARYPTLPLAVEVSICESERESLYQIRELLKHTIATHRVDKGVTA